MGDEQGNDPVPRGPYGFRRDFGIARPDEPRPHKRPYLLFEDGEGELTC